MTKQDLRSGMVVEMDDNEKMFVSIEHNCLMGERYVVKLSNLNEDLTHKLDATGCTIIAVYAGSYNSFNRILKEPGKLIWKREKAKELTVSEIEKLLGYPVKIVKE